MVGTLTYIKLVTQYTKIEVSVRQIKFKHEKIQTFTRR